MLVIRIIFCFIIISVYLIAYCNDKHCENNTNQFFNLIISFHIKCFKLIKFLNVNSVTFIHPESIHTTTTILGTFKQYETSNLTQKCLQGCVAPSQWQQWANLLLCPRIRAHRAQSVNFDARRYHYLSNQEHSLWSNFKGTADETMERK